MTATADPFPEAPDAERTDAGPFVAAVLRAVATGDPSGLRCCAASACPDRRAAVTAFGHGLGLLAHALLAEMPEARTTPGWPELVGLARVRTAEELVRDRALRDLGAAAAGRGIPVVGVRGSGRIAAAYPDPALRQRSDLDLLVPAGWQPEFLEMASESGFTTVPTVGHCMLRRESVTVDLATRPSDLVRQTGIPGEARTFGDLDADWCAAAVPGPCAGIRHLSAPVALLLAALHYGYKHRFLRHGWGLDLVLLGRAMTAAERDAAAALALRTGTGPLFAAALAQADRICGVTVLADVVDRLPARARRGACRPLLARCARGPTSLDLGHLLALVCARDAGFVRRLVGRMLIPPPGELARQGLGVDGPRWHDYARHYLRMPARLLRALG